MNIYVLYLIIFIYFQTINILNISLITHNIYITKTMMQFGGNEVFLMLSSSNYRESVKQSNLKGDPIKGIDLDQKLFRRKFASMDLFEIRQTSKFLKQLLTRKFIVNWLGSSFGRGVYDIYLFYSGHGHINGNWAIDTQDAIDKEKGDELSLDELIEIWKKNKQDKGHLYIFMDSCYSGSWCYQLGEKNIDSISIFSSCQRNQTSKDINGGGLFKCVLGPQAQFQANYQLMNTYQSPVFINNSKRASRLFKSHLKQLNQGIFNARNFRSGADISQVQPNRQDKYTGPRKNGKKHGKGTMQYANGANYQGEWVDDRQHGFGIFTSPQGDKYNGQYKNGIQEGRGKFKSNIGYQYDGSWKNGTLHGKGKSIYRKQTFDGQFIQGKLNGKCKITLMSGFIYQAQFVNGKLEGKSRLNISTRTNNYSKQIKFKNGKKQP